MRAVLYCRVSSTEQAQNLSLPTQDKACREYAARNAYEVDRLFVDAESAKTTADRPEFLKLLAYCREQRGRLQAVIVYSVNRFARNNADHHAVRAILTGLGITLRSVTEPIDESPTGKLMEGILAAMAQFDNDVKSERVTAGMHEALSRGRWVSRPPLGLLAGGRGAPSLVPDPARAPAVREAFTLCAAGVRGRMLIQRLTAMGLQTRHGNALTPQTLYAMLRNRAYLGLVRTPGAGEARGDFEALVDEETFGRVQAQLTAAPTSTKAIARHRNHPGFPLRRFAQCGVCGRPLTGSASKGRRKRYGFYHCPKGCTRLPAGTLEHSFLRLADTLRPKASLWALFRRHVLDVWQESAQTHEAARRAIERQVATLKRQARQLDEAFIFERRIDRDTYDEQRDRLRDALAGAQLELLAASDRERSVDADLDYAYDVLANASRLWTDATSVETRQQMQWLLFPAGIVVTRGSTTADGRPELEPQIRAVSCWEFFELPDVSLPGGKNGAPFSRMLEPRLAAWLTHVRQLRLLAEAA